MSHEHGGGGGDGHDGEHAKKHKKHHAHGAHPEHEHEEGWIVSFADNVLLMMGFFVILLAMNMGPKGTSDASADTAEDRLLDVAIAVREAFNNPVSMSSGVPEDQPLIRRIRQKKKNGEQEAEKPNGDPEKPQALAPTDWAGDGGVVHFEQKGSELDTTSRETIRLLAQRIRGKRWIIEIRGHSSRWEAWRDTKASRDLSYARAWAVGNELVEQGISWDQIRLTSSGNASPVMTRTRNTDDARTNQRAEILVLNEVMPADPYSHEEEAAGGEPE